MLALKALAALLAYPEPELVAALPEIREIVAAEKSIARDEQLRIAALIDELAGADIYDAQEKYVDLFDRGRATSLHLFEHVHGDARDRGPAMVDLNALYARGGLELAGHQLPDYLPAVLEYLSLRPLAEIRDMLGDCAHILRAVGTELAGRDSRYSAVFGALLAIVGVAGFDYQCKRQPKHEHEADAAAVDEAWAESPVMFGPGCSDIQPKVQVVRFMNKVA
jgi:nitrate reductase molybdenum cofactor assembly chaperone NarJ/NarW